MSQQLISKMAKQSILQRQAAAAALKAQTRMGRQRPFSCLAMASDKSAIHRPKYDNATSTFRYLRREGWTAYLPSSQMTATPSLRVGDHRVRWFSEDSGEDNKKSQKEKKKEMKQKAKEATAAKAAKEVENSEDAPSTKPEANSAAADDVKEESAAANEAPAQEEKPKKEGKKEEDDDDDDVPDWQNPLHHNNPDMKKVLEEDFAPGEEMPLAEAPPLEDPENPEKVLASQELYDLADDIVSLSMLEMTELVNKIGDHFGFEKPPFVGSDGSGGGGDEADEEGDGEVAEAAAAKTAFDIKLVSFDDKAKIKVIKEVRALAGLGLKEAKEMVEGAPGIVMKDIGKEQAEELKTKLEAAGASVEIV
jgi:large subunit ribosomal protein L7/L12